MEVSIIKNASRGSFFNDCKFSFFYTCRGMAIAAIFFGIVVEKQEMLFLS